jgi:hypothetical protein
LDKYVLHSHSVYANLAACTKECTDIVEKALANANYSWGFVRYSDPGAKLTFSIRDEIQRIKEKNGEIPPIILMENHGLIVHHNDSQACLEIHDEVNERIARIFGITGGTFPKVAVRENEDGRLISEVPYLEESLKTGKYGMRELVEDALYPDQIVFLSGIFLITDHNSILEKNMCYADKRTGKVIFNMPQGKAQVIAETLTAVIFIRENVERSEYTLSTMGDAAKKFIENWESEKYRKSLVGK